MVKDEREIVQWWTLLQESERKSILSEIPNCLAYGNTKAWSLLSEAARDEIRAGYANMMDVAKSIEAANNTQSQEKPQKQSKKEGLKGSGFPVASAAAHQITITIRTDNAAFADDEGYEVGRILSELADRYKSGAPIGSHVRDINGNTVGDIQVERL